MTDPAWFAGATYAARCGDALALDDLDWGAHGEPANYREDPGVSVTPEDEHQHITTRETR